MNNYTPFHTQVWYGEDDDHTWSAVPNTSEPHSLNDVILRMAMPIQEDWSWQLTATTSPQSFLSQSYCVTNPVQGNNAEVVFDATSHGHSLGMAAAQWTDHNQDSQQQFPGPPYNAAYTTFNEGGGETHPFQQQPSPPQLYAASQVPVSFHDKQDVHPPLAIPWPDVFASTRGVYQDPPFDAENQPQAQRKSKRTAEDLYTPLWVRNRGTQREGWCGWCSNWYTLRDSTYWYHMHYSHGVSQADGKRLPAPAGFRTFCGSSEWEVKCGKCNKWMPLPPGDRWNTAYFRHTYKCYVKSTQKAESTSSPPQRPKLSPARRSHSNML